LPTKGDKIEWKKYRELELSLLQETLQEFHEKMAREYGVPVPNADSLLQTAHYSPYLNIYAYPEELDYLDIRPLPPTFRAFPHFIRLSEKAEEDFSGIPEEFLSLKLGKLVYVSMGSMGSVCRLLMSRLVEMLSSSTNRFIFSLGPSYDHLTKEKGPLPSNIWAAKFVPQIEVLQLVDLVVTHGGNNTLLESLYFGKPMIVCPLFAEQPENAQRLEEVGLGLRINPYTCEPEEMLSKIEQLLGDEALKQKLKVISQQMQASQSTQQVAQAIVKVAKSEL
ncbi:PREDICTED: uncharacterized UDP-glucosyltransferase YdhE-like, partial [Rhagoletis zephyria]|uniref:uncharacterized UDP-glucosyltransferase YdhE-like n=1 Tax=Rhagoletis zephyria TaxID=28612 RepID=UPI0008113B87